jgi:hypothetical protein
MLDPNLQLAALLDQAEFLRQHQITANLQLSLHKCLLGVDLSGRNIKVVLVGDGQSAVRLDTFNSALLDLTRLVLQVSGVNNCLAVLSLQVELEHALDFINEICVLADGLGHSIEHGLRLQSGRTGAGSSSTTNVQFDASVVDHNLDETIVIPCTAMRSEN